MEVNIFVRCAPFSWTSLGSNIFSNVTRLARPCWSSFVFSHSSHFTRLWQCVVSQSERDADMRTYRTSKTWNRPTQLIPRFEWYSNLRNQSTSVSFKNQERTQVCDVMIFVSERTQRWGRGMDGNLCTRQHSLFPKTSQRASSWYTLVRDSEKIKPTSSLFLRNVSVRRNSACWCFEHANMHLALLSRVFCSGWFCSVYVFVLHPPPGSSLAKISTPQPALVHRHACVVSTHSTVEPTFWLSSWCHDAIVAAFSGPN